MFRASVVSGIFVVLLTGFIGCGGERKPTFEGVEQDAAQKPKAPAERIDYAIGALTREDPRKALAACKRLASFGADSARAIPDLEKCAAEYPENSETPGIDVRAAAREAIEVIKKASAGSSEAE